MEQRNRIVGWFIFDIHIVISVDVFAKIILETVLWYLFTVMCGCHINQCIEHYIILSNQGTGREKLTRSRILVGTQWQCYALFIWRSWVNLWLHHITSYQHVMVWSISSESITRNIYCIGRKTFPIATRILQHVCILCNEIMIQTPMWQG